MRRVIVAALLLTACGGGGGAAPADAEVDASPAGPNQVTLEGFLDGALLAYRDGNGPWRSMTRVANGWAMGITDDYTFIVACGTATAFDAQMFARTWADGATQYGACAAPQTTPPQTVAVTGQMVQPGTVWAYGFDSGTTSPWSFTIQAPPRTHDVFAISADHIAVRRGIPIFADTALPSIDVDQEGSPLVSVPLTINGLDLGDTTTASLIWFGSNDGAIIDGTPTQLLAPPDAIFDTNDFEAVRVDARQGASDRNVLAYPFGNVTQAVVDLMPSLTGITFSVTDGAVIAGFGALPTYDDLELSLVDAATSSQESFSASPSWVAATGATSVGWASTPPGYPSNWRIDPTAVSRTFTATKGTGRLVSTSSVSVSAGVRAVTPKG